MTLKCPRCNQEWVFDNEHIGKNGKKIPLDPATHSPHDCPMREKPVPTTEFLNKEYGRDKDDHGNEQTFPAQQDPFQKMVQDSLGVKPTYVDHTQGQKLKLKTITDPTPEGVDLKYNRLADEQKIRYSQSHVEGSQYTVYVWYEEVTKQ